LKAIMNVDPRERITAKGILAHKWMADVQDFGKSLVIIH